MAESFVVTLYNRRNQPAGEVEVPGHLATVEELRGFLTQNGYDDVILFGTTGGEARVILDDQFPLNLLQAIRMYRKDQAETAVLTGVQVTTDTTIRDVKQSIATAHNTTSAYVAVYADGQEVPSNLPVRNAVYQDQTTLEVGIRNAPQEEERFQAAVAPLVDEDDWEWSPTPEPPDYGGY